MVAARPSGSSRRRRAGLANCSTRQLALGVTRGARRCRATPLRSTSSSRASPAARKRPSPRTFVSFTTRETTRRLGRAALRGGERRRQLDRLRQQYPEAPGWRMLPAVFAASSRAPRRRRRARAVDGAAGVLSDEHSAAAGAGDGSAGGHRGVDPTGTPSGTKSGSTRASARVSRHSQRAHRPSPGISRRRRTTRWCDHLARFLGVRGPTRGSVHRICSWSARCADQLAADRRIGKPFWPA